MTDCYHSDDYDNDSKVKFLSDVHNFKFKKINFCKHNIKKEDKDEITNIFNFDISKVSVESNAEDDFKILYDNKTLKIKIISFCGLAKSVKDLKRNKYFKIKNRLASMKIWEVFCNIHKKFYETLNFLKLFVDSMKVILECDERLLMYTLNCFEDCKTYFGLVAHLPSKICNFVKYKRKNADTFCSEGIIYF